eukprot:TRINITY_DN1018_c0_g2_i5.p1 TRINITY_DN1018_c0_g2~~TRINITY_DN1018_c0_g2_i5.p1  ORF type:complete len:592 (+),score=135.87 TRINITY_DN1018_c0_g2_i5:256-2031(+)
MWVRISLPNAPYARCAHQTEFICDKLYVMGGWNEVCLNDVHCFDPQTMNWEDEIVKQINEVIPRSGHTMTLLPNGVQALIFGGSHAIDPTRTVYLNDIVLYHAITKEWIAAYACGNCPSGRSKHTATRVGNFLFIIGGGDGVRLYDDVFVLDLESMTWSSPPLKGVPPSPRWGHSTAFLPPSQLIVFGGYSGGNRMNDVHILNIDTFTWTRVPNVGRSGNEDIPSPRAGHTATLVGRHMLVMGGGNGRVFCDMYCLDTETLRWWKIGFSAPPLCAHSASLGTDGKLYCFGGGDGIHCFNQLYILENTVELLEALYQAIPIPSAKTTQQKISPKGKAIESPPPAPSNTTTPTSTNQNNNNNNNNNHTQNQNQNNHNNHNSSPHSSNSSPNSSPRKRGGSRQRHSQEVKNLNLVSADLTISENTTNTAPSQSLLRISIPENLKTLDNFSPPQTPSSQSTQQQQGRWTRSPSSSTHSTPSSTPNATPPSSPRTEIVKTGGRKRSNSKSKNSNNNNNSNNGNSLSASATLSDVPEDIAGWLSSIGMSKYIPRFVAEEVDLTILNMITDSHLKLIGVSTLGDRLRILNAIGKTVLV